MSISKPSIGTVRSGRSALFASVFETLEARQLLSTTPYLGAYSPQQIRTAYGASALGLANEGQGVTVGIVDELNDSTITADLKAYSSYYNLPALDGLNGDPTFQVVNDTFGGSVGAAGTSGVAEETALDVEMVHAMAPLANIILVQVSGSAGTYAALFADLLHGVQVAATDGATSISLSYGTTEASVGASSVTSQNATYLASGAAANVSVSVSTGDSGTPSYPATSPNVVAVGGTALYLANLKGTYSFETGWGGLSGDGSGGGGLSANFASPTFQSANGVSYAKRSIPDVSLVADPVTGVSIYDSTDFPGTPWTAVGGTSVASPVFAGIVSLAQQNRVAAGLAPLNSVQIDTEMYKLYNSPSYSTYFNDVTTGNNKDGSYTGFSATTGYDQATGLGSPNAATLIPLLSTFTPTSNVTVKLGGGLGGAIARGAASTTISASADPDFGTTSVYDLIASPTGKTITPGFARAVAQAQQSPVVSAVPLIDSIEISTATHTLYSPIALLNAGQSVIQGNYSYGGDDSQSANAGLASGDLGLSKDLLDALSGSVLLSVA